MAIAAATGFQPTTFDALFKDKQIASLPFDIMNNRTTLWGMLPKETDPFGRRIIDAIRTGRLTSMGNTSATAALKNPRSPKYANPILLPKEFNAVGKVFHNTIQRSKTSEAARRQAVTELIRTTIDDSMDDLERQVSNDGSSVLAAANAATVVAGTPGTFTTTKGLTATTEPEDARKFEVDEEIEAFSTNTPAAAQRTFNAGVNVGTVTIVNPDTGVITVDEINAAGDFDTNGGFISRFGARTATTSFEFMGLAGIVSAADPPMNGAGAGDQLGLQGLTVAANPRWASPNLANGGTLRPLTPRILEQAADASSIRSGKNGYKHTHLFATYGSRIELGVLTENINRRINTTRVSGETSMGFRENEDADDFMMFRGIKIIPLKYLQQNIALLVCMPCIKFWQVSEPHWVDDTGSVMRPSTDRTVSAEIIYHVEGNLCTTNRAAHCRISDVLGDDPA